MADDIARIRAQLLDQRRTWVPLPDGRRRLRIVRPVETELYKIVQDKVTVEVMLSHVDGWEGFTLADILGPDIGSNDPVEFDAGLCADWIKDNADAATLAVHALADIVRAYLEKRAGVEKN